jgi:hypothetical protein
MQAASSRRLQLLVLVAAISCTCALATTAGAQTAAPRTPVLVELFTSEGCSSCPPADALLGHLLRDQPVPAADIIVLSEHVDYWDSLGWRDRFSSHLLTERQNAYATRFAIDGPYTPQIVVDGTDQFAGSDSSRAQRSIAQAAHKNKLTITLSPIDVHSGSATGRVSVAPNSSTLSKADLYVALVEVTTSTRVQRGENGGRTLQHVSVVRAIQRIGSLDALSRDPLPFSLTIPPDTTANLQVIAFAQQQGEGVILSVAETPQFSTQKRGPEQR